MESNKIIIFQDRKIRRIWHDDEWYYSVADIVTVLTDTVNATDYIKKLRKRDDELAKGWGQIVTPLEIETSGGKTSGKNGQFRTLRHIIKMMVELTAPKIGDIICDPACGTAGFLVAAYEHILKTNTSAEFIKRMIKGTNIISRETN